MRPPILRVLPLLCALALPLAPLGAQRVLGPTEDAVTIPRGVLRIAVGGELTVFRDRWNYGTLEKLGAGFSGPLDPTRLAILAPLQDDVRAQGVAGFTASLGDARLDLRQRIFVTPFSLEYGATEWLTVGVSAPLVRVRAEGLYRLDGTAATVGPNPFFLGSAVPASNQAAIDRFVQASASLAARRDGCAANPASAPECPTILAEAANVDALIGTSAGFAQRLERIYGGQGATPPSPYVPLAGSPTELALQARVDAMRTALERYGVTDLATAGLPLGAQTPLSAADLEALIQDPAAGYGARPLTSSARLGLGDIDVTARVRLWDTFGGTQASRLAASRFGFRQSVGVILRVGSGTPADPGDFLDLGTGAGENAIGFRSYTDVVLDERFWTSVVVGWAQAQGEEVRVRVPSSYGPQLLEPWREVTATVTRRPLYQAEISPRYIVNDYLAIGGYYGWRHKTQDRFEYPAVTAPSGAPVTTVDPLTATREQRAGLTLTFSTLAAQQAGRVKRAFELSLTHQQSIGSTIGLTPKRWEDRVHLRYYTRLFGR